MVLAKILECKSGEFQLMDDIQYKCLCDSSFPRFYINDIICTELVICCAAMWHWQQAVDQSLECSNFVLICCSINKSDINENQVFGSYAIQRSLSVFESYY